MLLKIMYFYVVFTRGIIFGYFLKDKRKYKFDYGDYFEYLMNFFFIELVFLIPRISYPFIYVISRIVDFFQEEK